MWGNRQGWLISLGIVVAAVAILWLIAHSSTRTPPTAFSADPRNFAKLAVPQPPNAPSAAPEHGGSYRVAIEGYLQNRALYEDFAATGTLKSSKLAELTAVDQLVSAAGSPSIFAQHPEEIVNYDHTKPPLEALGVLGNVMLDRLALLNERAGNHESAEKYARAGIALGTALCDERLTFEEFALGQELLSKSATLLSKTDPATWQAFEQQRSQFFSEQIQPIVRFLRSIDPNTVGTRTGDVFELARRAQERMWRVEAILALGRVRFFVGTSRSAADQRAATALVKKIAEEETDPVIREAAIAARDLTAEQYRMQ